MIAGALIWPFDSLLTGIDSIIIINAGGIQCAVEKLASMAISNLDVCENDVLHHKKTGNAGCGTKDACFLKCRGTKSKSFIGRLPELNISCNIHGIFGDDFIGATAESPAFGEQVWL